MADTKFAYVNDVTCKSRIIRQKGKPLFQAKDKGICMYIFTVNCDHFDY